LVAATAQKLVRDGYTVLITVEQIKHGKALEALIQGSKFVHGKTKKEERDKELKNFEDGKLKILISTLLGEGWDCQGLDAIILASGGKSEASLIQKVGRTLRTKDGKQNAIIIDIQDGGKWLRDHSQLRKMTLEETYGN
jgi:superfamily II DNA or RNA helicase